MVSWFRWFALNSDSALAGAVICRFVDRFLCRVSCRIFCRVSRKIDIGLQCKNICAITIKNYGVAKHNL